MTRRLTLVAAAALALLVAGCGGTTKKSGVSSESGASLVSSDAVAYVSVDSDLGSSQWQQVNSLLKKFPDHDTWLADLRSEVKKEGLDYDSDIKPALGPEVDFAVSGAGSGQTPSFVALTKPDSMEKARALVKKLNAQDPSNPSATREVDGWLAVADKQRDLDAVLKGSSGTSLADDSTFKDAVAALPTDALAKAYVNGKGLNAITASLLPLGAQIAADGSNPAPYANLEWAGAAIVAKDDGVRLEADAKGSGGKNVLGSGSAFASKLISGVPGDAVAFLNFRGTNLTGQLGRLRQNPALGPALRQAEAKLGVNVDDVLELFSHEIGFYVRRGVGLPEFTLALETPDTASALATIDRIAAHVAALTHGTLGTDNQAGVSLKTLTIKPVVVRWGGFDGRVLLTTGPTGVADYRASGSKLADDGTYKDALSAAGTPDKTAGLVYLNLHDGLQLIESYAGLSGNSIPPNIAADLKPLHSFVAYTTASGDVSKSVAFLEIK
jgi:Protein of unknown function (DUF3352)